MLMPKLLYLVTEDWYFWSHRLPMARAARDAGFDVAVATRVREHGERIRNEGFHLHPLPFDRGGLRPDRELAVLRQVVGLYRAVRPEIVHHVAVKPVLVGALAGRIARVPAAVHGLTGLGFIFVGGTLKARTLRAVLRPVLRRLLDGPGSRVLVQNPDDRDQVIRAWSVDPGLVRIIPGSGVDTLRLRPLPEPNDGPPTAAFVGRMLKAKGVADAVAAQRWLRQRGVPLRLLLCGAPDPENPSSVDSATLRRWAAEPGIDWLGHVADVREIWRQAHMAVLPSGYGEGVPLSLLEAAACGRPLVATDVPGCREIARDEETGSLVPLGDVEALAGALARLAGDPALRQRWGEAGRRLVERRFSAEIIGRDVVALYRELLAGSAARAARREPDSSAAADGRRGGPDGL